MKFSGDDIGEIIRNLNPNKAHGHDRISIRMLQICGPSLYKPLRMIFEKCFTSGSFPAEWKRGNIVPIHKKMINSLSIIIGQFRYCLFVVKF